MSKNWAKRLAMLLLAGSLSGCAILGGGADKAEQKAATLTLRDKDNGTLNVLVVSSDTSSFMRDYGGTLLAKFPQIDFQVKGLPSDLSSPGTTGYMDKAGDFIAQEKPDLIFTYQLADPWVKKGLLLDLDSMVKQDKFDIENLHPGAVEPIRRQGNGKLYGLSPSINATALIYNKDLFDRYHIPFPTDGMTWEQVIALARKFPTDGDSDNRVYGFAWNSPDASWLIRTIAAQAGLVETDPTGTKVAINSPAWKAIWHLVLDNASAMYYRPSFMPGPGSTLTDSLKRDRFLAGSAAMSLATSSTLGSMSSSPSNGMKPFQWDLVTEPTDPRYPGETTSYSPGDIFAIGAQGSNQKLAWEIVKYVTGAPFASIYQKVVSYRFPARISAVGQVGGHSLDAFFKLKPSKLDLTEMRKNMPSAFFGDYYTLVQTALQKAQDGKPVDSVLDGLQTDLQKKLDERNATQAAPTKGGSGS